MSTHLFHPLPGTPSPDNDNGQAITNIFKEGGPGTTVLLVPKATYVLFTSIDFTHARTTLATDGYPTFESGEQAILETRGEKEAGAVNMFNKAEVALKRVHLRGCRGWGRTKPESKEEEERLRKEGKLGWIEGGGALVWMGGPQSHDAVVEGCRLEDPRGWTAVHVCDWAMRNKVINNLVGPCGQEAGGGPWADGLSIAGVNSLIAGNTVIDATDGAIVVFCAPGSIIANNTIIARGRDVLGAINMVDDFPFDRDFTDTRVVGNTIRSEGAFIRLAIGCGPTCWSPWFEGHTLNHGGSVTNNYFGPGVMGYAIALSGVKEWTVLGNTILEGTRFTGNMERCLGNAPPTPFLKQWADRQRTIDVQLQPGFVNGEASWLIGVDPGAGPKLDYEAGQLTLNSRGESLAGKGGIALRGARWEVSHKGEFLLRESQDPHSVEIGHGKVIWSSGSGSDDAKDPVLDFKEDGILSIRSNGGSGSTSWDPTSYLKPHLDQLASLEPLKKPKNDPAKWASHPSLILSNSSPFLQLRTDEGNLVFATSYEYSHGDNWSMQSGQWIAIAPAALRGYQPSDTDTTSTEPPRQDGPPPIPPRQHHFSSFVKDLSSNLQNFDTSNPAAFFDNMTSHQSEQSGPPPIPPRPDTCPAPSPSTAHKPVFLFLNPQTHQLTLHSSSSPAHPEPEHIHWVVPPEPVDPPADKSWFAMQYDSNAVLYVQRGEEVFVPWASHTGGDRGLKLVLKGEGEDGGPALELVDKDGKKAWSSRG
ncbi:hypothetical protein BCR35DRAFT_350075 [Leucosporidium creatinivorum]|uniref:Right handed beta helix domain-containing protein n=1 Tax=Leucosporidium creatinivorum TaxID=106004 RepID=A0A1Y2FZJ1_9BASI|nr:hypothetical protein BCR35DRAFT_350075 [Leucosporidium creatinivorum]